MNSSALPKLLVVDDRPENLVAMRTVLKPLDVEVIEANSGVEALSLILRHSLALILLDVQMPEMDGYEVAELCRSHEETALVPIIFVTAINKDDIHVFKGYESGAVDYLSKPINTDVLRSKVKIFLELDKKNRQLAELVESLEKTTAELTLSNKKLADYNHVIAHDLKNPITTIMGFAGFLNSRYGNVLDEKGNDFVNRIRSSAERMSNLITMLLTEAEERADQCDFQQVDLKMVLKEVLDDLDSVISKQKATITVSDLPTIDADAKHMYQLFQNLVSNALKYSQDGVPLEVKIESELDRKENYCIINVIDNGIGFSEEDAKRIFEPFERVQAISDSYEGSGIGLSTVMNVVNQHHGEITASGVVGKGATFSVTLPMRQVEDG